jgi:hypothetical protein
MIYKGHSLLCGNYSGRHRALLGYAVIWVGKEEVWVRVSVVGMVAVLRLTICHQDPLTGKEA